MPKRKSPAHGEALDGLALGGEPLDCCRTLPNRAHKKARLSGRAFYCQSLTRRNDKIERYWLNGSLHVKRPPP